MGVMELWKPVAQLMQAKTLLFWWRPQSAETLTLFEELVFRYEHRALAVAIRITKTERTLKT